MAPRVMLVGLLGVSACGDDSGGGDDLSAGLDQSIEMSSEDDLGMGDAAVVPFSPKATCDTAKNVASTTAGESIGGIRMAAAPASLISIVWMRSSTMPACVGSVYGGGAWATPNDFLPSDSCFIERPIVLAAGNGAATFAWYHTPAGVYTLQPRCTTGGAWSDGGSMTSSWSSTPEELVQSAVNGRARLFGADDGELTLLWETDSGGNKTVNAKRRTPAGTWSAEAQLGSNDSDFIHGFIDDAGHVTVVRRPKGAAALYHNRIAKGATTWNGEVRVDKGAAVATYFDATYDPSNGDVIVAWETTKGISYTVCH